MNFRALVLCLIVLFLSAVPDTARSQQKLAQTGFNFLLVGTDARATAMGEAFTTVEGSPMSLFYNPAGLGGMRDFISLSTNQLSWIADIKYLSGGIAVAPFDGRYGVIGISLMNVNYGEFKFTRVAATEQGYEDLVGYPKPSAYMVGIGYAKELSTQFVVGGQVKYAYQSLGESAVPIYNTYVNAGGQVVRDTNIVQKAYDVGVLAFDFGTIYRTGWKGLAFGMTINNFSKEVRYVRENFQLPLQFTFGISMDVLELVPGGMEGHSLTVAIDAVHPRSYPELLRIGGEYVFYDAVFLRAGYVTHHQEYGSTFGIGVRQFGLAIDYSYMPHDVFSDFQRFSVSFSL